MGAREFYIKSSELSLEELAKKIMEVQKQKPNRSYDLAPITIEFNNNFTNRMGEKFTIETGEKFLLISGDGNSSINELLEHLPENVAASITGYNTLDLHHQEIHNYIKVINHDSIDKMIDFLKDEKKLEKLEYAGRASVKGKLAENKAKIEAKESVEKEVKNHDKDKMAETTR